MICGTGLFLSVFELIKGSFRQIFIISSKSSVIFLKTTEKTAEMNLEMALPVHVPQNPFRHKFRTQSAKYERA